MSGARQNTQADLDEAASVWLAQRRMLPADEFDEARFRAWIVADPRHEAAYAEMARAAGLAGELRDLRARQAGPGRRTWTAAGAMAAAAALVLFFAAPMLSAPQARYETAVAQVEAWTLPDGSTVTLAPASRVDVHLSGRERRVVLAAGEAFFEVAHDGQRPFLVEAGDASVRVLGTRFDVRRGEGAVRVSVAEGVVQVRAAAAVSLGAPAPVLLRAGDRADLADRVSPLAPAPAPILSQQAPAAAGAWREGHLAYVEAPLSELVADLNRYHAPGVRLSDPALGEFRLTASFRAGDLETFFSTLPDAAPVTVARGPSGEVVIGPAR